MVYGLFLLAAGLSALFFLFNAGQLTQEKDKLTITADATAYSAGVLHARALNFTAYTNRALVANEIAVAQIVSIGSWTRYTNEHSTLALSFGCETIYNWPAGETFIRYAPLCMGLAYASYYTAEVQEWVDTAASATVTVIEGAKIILQGAQVAMMVALPIERRLVMQEVADANFRNNGAVRVDVLPLQDNFFAFEGQPFLGYRTGNDRTRFKSVAVEAANRDSFVPSRNWSDSQLIPHPCAFSLRSNRMDRSGGTSMVGLDEWRAGDNVRYTRYYTKWSWSGPKCRSSTTTLAQGDQSAGGSASSNNWSQYSGLPGFLEMSDRALAYMPENADANKRDPRIRFAIRVTRSPAETRTSEGRSAIRQAPGGGAFGVNQYRNDAAGNEYAAVSTSEVFFERPLRRADGRTELASVFNPYWQVHLVETSAGVMAAARALQGVPF